MRLIVMLSLSLAVGILIWLVAAYKNSRPKKHTGGARHQNWQADHHQPAPRTKDANKEGWHADEKEHRRTERRYWKIQTGLSGVSLFLSIVAVGGAVAGVAISFQAFKESQKSSRAAWEQVRVARESYTASEQAFVFMKALSPHYLSENGVGLVNFWALWHNSGGSQTKILKIWHSCEFGRRTDKLDFHKHSKEFEALLGPGSETYFATCSVPRDMVTFDKDKPYFLFGGASYKDIFGEPHVFQYCIQFEGFDTTPCNGINGGHNCADDECPSD